MKKQSTKLFALLLAIIMIVGMLPTVAFAGSGTNGEAIVFAASDYQSSSAKSNMTAIVERIANDYDDVDGTLFTGDYSYGDGTNNTGNPSTGINDINAIFTAAGWTPENQVFCQGNHDGTAAVDTTGEHDTDDYGVYLIREDDYPSSTQRRAGVRATAAALKTYLDAKVTAGYNKPIFVVTHLPLHNTSRGDNKYACELFDVLNSYGDSLTIIYLFGHNHSGTYDAGIGYSTFLTSGDSMDVPQGSSPAASKKLNFTYMNAGYIGQHQNNTLTATVFEISDQKVVIKRYDKNGTTLLKTAGATDTKTYKSPYTLNLTDAVIDASTGIYTAASKIEGGKTYVITAEGMGMNATPHPGYTNTTNYSYSGFSGTAVTASDDKITSTVTDDMLWKAEAVTGGFALKNVSTGEYLTAYGQSSSGGNGGRIEQESTPQAWTLDNDKLKNSSTSRYLAWDKETDVSNGRKSGDAELFTLRSNGDEIAIYLYTASGGSGAYVPRTLERSITAKPYDEIKDSDKLTVNAKVGDTVKLTISHESGQGKDYTFTSTNTSVVSAPSQVNISARGSKVIELKCSTVGTATIEGTGKGTSGGRDYKLLVEIIVSASEGIAPYAPAVIEKEITAEKKEPHPSITVNANEGDTIKVALTHASGEFKNFSYKSSDASIVSAPSGTDSVQPNSSHIVEIKCLKAGQATVFCTGVSPGTGNTYYADIVVNVAAALPSGDGSSSAESKIVEASVTAATAGKTIDVAANVGDAVRINLTNGSSYNAKNYSFSTPNDDLVKLPESANIAKSATKTFDIECLKAGQAVVTATSDVGSGSNIYTATINITISDAEGSEGGNEGIEESVAMTVGMDGKYVRDSEKGLSFTSSAEFNDFVGVEVDSKLIERDTDYTAASGSTIVTLLPKFLDGLTAGKHTIKIVSKNGSATADFTIENAPEEPSVPEGLFAYPATAQTGEDQDELDALIAKYAKHTINGKVGDAFKVKLFNASGYDDGTGEAKTFTFSNANNEIAEMVITGNKTIDNYYSAGKPVTNANNNYVELEIMCLKVGETTITCEGEGANGRDYFATVTVIVSSDDAPVVPPVEPPAEPDMFFAFPEDTYGDEEKSALDALIDEYSKRTLTGKVGQTLTLNLFNASGYDGRDGEAKVFSFMNEHDNIAKMLTADGQRVLNYYSGGKPVENADDRFVKLEIECLEEGETTFTCIGQYIDGRLYYAYVTVIVTDPVIRIPVKKVVEQGRNVTPPAQDFDFEIFLNADGDAVKVGTIKTTGGEKEYDRILEIPRDAFGNEISLERGFYLREKNDKVTDWHYSTEVYFIQRNNSSDVARCVTSDGETASAEESPTWLIEPVTAVKSEDGTYSYERAETPEYVDVASFTNTYTKNQSSGGGDVTRYILTYESNGGTTYPNESYSYGTKVDLNKTPVREGYDFTGWYSDKGATNKITSVTMTSNKTVYAGWSFNGPLNTQDHVAYVKGYPDGTVGPNNNITRVETAVMLYRLLTKERSAEITTTVNSFSDVSTANWYNTEVSSMAKGGYVFGYEDGTFGGDKAITRAEFVTMMVRFINPAEGTKTFTDVPSTHWAYKNIATATAASWIDGYTDGSFGPDKFITRAEAMTIINRVLNRGVDEDSTLLNFKKWPDNKASDWFYYDVIEATNGHEYTGSRPSEDWTKLY